ncbi:BZ3500_MvSof-1268-A1-R1_Chr1-3g02442 [Microbotryum saponariae]|uniref:BZ3500_MvSof-1268-A1-R1_Chr1-3g02442 protein n=1 Tax=Microbotryum saponariae TaxID=289078 RepID=A0A2X0KDH0_9BASI|nr:BZ3500_MvSof-1268-A1-R1_Chr1-3g02442 [Microbotryum saponariae]SCZ96240.1 BZ3501_MvSof-1269-A2-R1_Chr1-3g02045 [Microbotryum saponariae]
MASVRTPVGWTCSYMKTKRSFSTSSYQRWRLPSTSSLASLPIDVHPAIQQAQAERAPVVALESTLITHGMSPPHCYELPLECEAILRDQGVVPATIAILDGRIKVGLEPQQLAQLADKAHSADKSDSELWKVGRRELGACLVKGLSAGTTVSATMAIAHMVGIKVFSTGGIGGVHRGAETSFDISSDLIALADTPVAVVCAGSKSILDIGLTLEYLEAHAVPVASLATDEWPAFYSPTSGFKSPMRISTEAEAAEIIAMTDRLGLQSSLLLGVPIPKEHHPDGAAIQEAVERAIRESVENGMAKSGKAVTPWLLARVGQLTKGRAVISNRALIKNNVRVGGRVAQEYARLMKESHPMKMHAPAFPEFSRPPTSSSAPPTLATPGPPPPSASAALVVIGSLAVDISMIPTVSPLQTTSPGSVTISLGGVAGNVAAAARSIGIPDVLLVAAIGDDPLGSLARTRLGDRGMRSDGLITSLKDGRTPTCGYLLDEKGGLVGGVADMSIAASLPVQEVLERLKRAEPNTVVMDGNLSISLLTAVLGYCREKEIRTIFEPTSNAQSLKILRALSDPLPSSAGRPPTDETPCVSLITPNIHELQVLYGHVTATSPTKPHWEAGNWFDFITLPHHLLARDLPEWITGQGVVQMAVRLLPLVGCVLVKAGERGVVVIQRISGGDRVTQWRKKQGINVVVAPCTKTGREAVVVAYYPGIEMGEGKVVSVTGAGDSLAGALGALMSRGKRLDDFDELKGVVDVAQQAAVRTLMSSEAVGDLTGLRDALPVLTEGW